MNNLEIYILGPKSSDVRLFLGNRSFKYVQKFGFTYNRDSFIASVDMNICAFKLAKQEKPLIEKDTVRIIIENFDKSPEKQIVKIILGESGHVGVLYNINFNVSVHFPYNELTLYPCLNNEIFEKFPSWVNIDYSKSIKEAI